MPHRRTLVLALAAPLVITLIAVTARVALPATRAASLSTMALFLAGASCVITVLSIGATGMLARAAARGAAPSPLLATGLTYVIQGGTVFAALTHALAVLTGLLLLAFLATAALPDSRGTALPAITLIGLLMMTLFVVLLIRLARHVLRGDAPLTVSTLGKRMTAGQGQDLWRRVRALARRVGTSEPNHIVIGLDPGCFITELDVRCLDTSLRGRTLVLSLPFMRIATVEELEGLIAHELAHLRSSDTRLGRTCARLFSSAANAATFADSVAGQLQLAVLAGPPAAVLQHVLDVLETAVSRQQHASELGADKTAGTIVQPAILALALMRAHMCMVWDDVTHVAYRQTLLAGSEPIDNYSALFEDVARNADVGFDMRALIAAQQPHPTDMHPALGARLRALGINTDDAFACALDIPEPLDSALTLLNEIEPVEVELTLAAHALRTGDGAQASAARIGGDDVPAREDMPEEVLVFASRRRTLPRVTASTALATVLAAAALILSYAGLRAMLTSDVAAWALIGGGMLIALLGGIALTLGLFAAFYAELAFGRRPVLRLCAYGIQAFNEIADGDILAWSELGDVIMMRKDRKGSSQTLAFVAGDQPTVLRRIQPWRRLLAQLLPGHFPAPHFVIADVLPMPIESAYTLVARYHDRYIRR